MAKVHCSDDEDTEGVGFLPVGVSRKRRGWEGDHLELERSVEAFDGPSSHAAVDLEQFRNRQIGVGYQAKHVVRQRSAPDPSIAIRDTTQEKTKKKKRKESNTNVNTVKEPKTRLSKYLECEEMRNFRKELASMEHSTT
jgi:hypothetical protein